MLNPMTQKATIIEERSQTMEKNAKIMLKLAEFLLEDHLISPEEKFKLTQLIRKDMDI